LFIESQFCLSLRIDFYFTFHFFIKNLLPMYRTPTSFLCRSSRALQCLPLLLLPFFSKANLGITPISSQDGNVVTVDFLVYNFSDIVSMQYTVHWDPTVMQFESVEYFDLPFLTDGNFGLFSTAQLASGNLTHSWLDFNTTGITLPECSTIYRVKYISLNGQVSPISIVGTPTAIEVVDANGNEVGLEQGIDCSNVGQIKGTVFLDTNGNCAKDDGEASVKDCTVRLEQNGMVYNLPVSEEGEYYYLGQTGALALNLIFPAQSNLISCTGVQTIQLTGNEQVELDFGVTTNGVSSTKEGTSNSFSTVFPNPARAGEAFNLGTNNVIESPSYVQLYSAKGALVQAWTSVVGNRFELSPNLPSGLYFLKMTDAKHSASQFAKLIIE
jgi:Secretion system C-terminal sorting domain